MFRFLKYFFVFCLVLLSISGVSQNESNQWYFGNNAGLNFNSTPPTALVNGAMTADEGCATISNASGNILFYTNGLTVFDKTHTTMANGTGLLGYFSSSQAAHIVKKPGSANLYYVFTQGASGNGLRYSIVDMSLAAGMGSVTVKNTLLSTPGSEKLMSTKHSNGIDVWVVTHDLTGNTFRSYLVSAAGVNAVAVVSSAGTSYLTGNDIGCIQFSPNGRKLAAALFDTNSGYEVYDFDNATGIVSNALFLATGSYKAYGVAFSQDGSKLYGSRLLGKEIYQWNMCAGSSAAIISSKFEVCGSTGMDKGQVQLGPNGKIYVARPGQQDLGVINNPNAAGAACNYAETGQSVAPKTCSFGFPNFIINPIIPPPPPFTYTLNGCQSVAFTAPDFVQPFPAMLCTSSGYSLSSIKWIFGDPASGAANTSTQINPVHVFPSLGTYTACLVLNYAYGGRIDSIKLQVVIGQLCLLVNSSNISCASLGSATVSTINGVGPFSYTWMPGGQTGSVATGLSPGTYSITVYDAGGNATSTSTTVLTASSNYTGNVIHNNQACNGVVTASATVTGLSGSGSQTYSWTNGTDTYTTAMPVGLSAGIWSVTVTDALTGCQMTQSFTITEPPAATLNIAANPSVACVGNSIILTGQNSGGTPAYTYSWASGPSTQTLSVSQNIVGTYIYTLNSADANNCSTSNTISVDFVNSPSLTVSNVTICPVQTGTLIVSGALSYTWSSPVGGPAVVDSIFTDTPLSTRQYTVIGSGHGCIATATAAMFVKPVPIPVISSNSPVCQGQGLQLWASDGTNYKWKGPLDFTSDVQNPLISPVSPANSGVYRLTVTIGGCNTGITKTITVLPSPVAAFEYMPAKPLENADPVIFTNASTGGAESYHWFIKDDQNIYTSVSNNTSYFFTNAGDYPVVLVVSNGLGCEDTIIRTVHVESDFAVYVPNTFTPNGDNLNDVFYPVVRGATRYTFNVFDRWGWLLFSTSDLSKGWDGTYNGGPCKQDIYVWKIQASGLKTNSKEFTGHVNLLR